MSTHNLIQDVKYFNFNIDNLILFFYIYDNFKFFCHQIISISIMLKWEQMTFNCDLKKKSALQAEIMINNMNLKKNNTDSHTDLYNMQVQWSAYFIIIFILICIFLIMILMWYLNWN